MSCCEAAHHNTERLITGRVVSARWRLEASKLDRQRKKLRENKLRSFQTGKAGRGKGIALNDR